jgi:hypothetical protein
MTRVRFKVGVTSCPGGFFSAARRHKYNVLNHASPLGFLRFNKATSGRNEQSSCCFTWHGGYRSIADFGGTYILLLVCSMNLSIEIFLILNANVSNPFIP